MKKGESIKMESDNTPIKKKLVYNRNNYRVELNVGDDIIVFAPRKSVSVSADVVIPDNLGLQVK